MLDLDRFKQINDQYGHGIGDVVLRRFADLLRTVCRGTDIGARLGGEEFALLLPETATDDAAGVAQRIVEECRAIQVPAAGGSVRFTCSIGVAEVWPLDDTIESAMLRADAALYRAKHEGRNRVVADPAIGPPAMRLGA
jgi:diguanylate cyclase (GGDEF)-like protein